MSQQCSWPTHSGPLEGRCPYYALLGLTQAPGFAGGPDSVPHIMRTAFDATDANFDKQSSKSHWLT